MRHSNKRSHSPEDDRRGRAPDLDARKSAREKTQGALWSRSRSRSPAPAPDAMHIEAKKQKKLKPASSDSDDSVIVTTQRKIPKQSSRNASPPDSGSSESDSEPRKKKNKKHKKKSKGKKKTKKSKKAKKASSSDDSSESAESEDAPNKETRLVAVEVAAETTLVTQPEQVADPGGSVLPNPLVLWKNRLQGSYAHSR